MLPLAQPNFRHRDPRKIRGKSLGAPSLGASCIAEILYLAVGSLLQFYSSLLSHTFSPPLSYLFLLWHWVKSRTNSGSRRFFSRYLFKKFSCSCFLHLRRNPLLDASYNLFLFFYLQRLHWKRRLRGKRRRRCNNHKVLGKFVDVLACKDSISRTRFAVFQPCRSAG